MSAQAQQGSIWLRPPEKKETEVLVLQDHEFDMLVRYVKENFGINLDQKKVLVEGRLGLHVSEAGYGSYQEYLQKVFADPTGSEVSNLVTRLTTNHTFFMREENHFKFLRQKVLPDLAKSSRDKDIRIWSAGCSSGEEPFTISMVLHEHLGFSKSQWDTRILATDISTRALDLARKAGTRLPRWSPCRRAGWDGISARCRTPGTKCCSLFVTKSSSAR